MSEPALHFTSVKIRRLLGFHDDGFDVTRLSPGVNIIYGPNAAGKTTFGLAIRNLLWRTPENTRDISIAGSLSVDGRTMSIDIDHGRITCQQDGQDVEPPRATSSESADRYVLALHDLLQDEPRDRSAESFARHILRESAGGYDLAGAADTLQFRTDPRTRSSTINQRLQQAREEVRKILQQQEALESQALQLDELRRNKQSAVEARHSLTMIAKAEAYLDAESHLREAELSVDVFPPQLEKIDGQEIARLEEYRTRRSRLEDEARGVQQTLAEAIRQFDEAALPRDSLSIEQIETWRNELRRLNEVQSRLEVATTKSRELQAIEETALKFFGPKDVAAEMQAVDASVVAELSAFARRWCHWDVRRKTNEEAVRLLSAEETNSSADELRQAGVLLDQWLTLIEPSSSVRRAGKFTTWALVLLALALVGVLLWQRQWLIGGIVAVVLPFAYRVFGSHIEQLAIDERAEIERQTAALDVPQPSTWTPEAVRRHRNAMQRAYNAATVDHQQAARRRELEDEQRQIELEGRELRSVWDQLAVRTIRPPVAADDPTFVMVWMSNLCEWQRAHRAREAIRRELKESRTALDTLHGKLCSELARFGCGSDLPSERLGPNIESLAARQQKVAKAQPIIASSTQRIDVIKQHLEQLDKQEQALFDTLGLQSNDEPTLRDWVRRRDDFSQARQNLDFARRQLAAAVQSLGEHVEWKDKTREELLAERSRREQIVDGAAEIDRQIGGIERDVENAKRQHDLEAALVDLDDQQRRLRARRDEDAAAMVGHVLVDYLKRQQRECDRPLVFQKAQESFVRITHGRYKLDIDERDPPRLRAIDTSTSRGQALDELSSGTRLQLLLSVRVAYIEQQEQGLRLPLVFDETLGNSDERRAGEIIDAAIELCRDGRQLFYLTAQWDEVAKWRSVLQDKYPGVPFAEVDLAERRGFSEQERIPPVELPRMPEPISIPPPEDHDLWSYRGLLGVPGFDPYRSLGGTHLWYLVDDPRALYELLKLGINNWGQLEALAARGGPRLDHVGEEVFARASASARVIEAFCTAWRIGRGRPTDRAVLQSSGLTSRWIDEVADLSKRLEGDARAIVNSLRQGGVKRMQKKTIEDLADYLREHHYLDDVEPLTADKIRSRVVSAATDFLNRGVMNAERIDWLLRMITPGVQETPRDTEAEHKPVGHRNITVKMTD